MGEVLVAETDRGSALRFGITAARGRCMNRADADDRINFKVLTQFEEKLREDCALAMGSRLQGRYQAERHAAQAARRVPAARTRFGRGDVNTQAARKNYDWNVSQDLGVENERA